MNDRKDSYTHNFLDMEGAADFDRKDVCVQIDDCVHHIHLWARVETDAGG